MFVNVPVDGVKVRFWAMVYVLWLSFFFHRRYDWSSGNRKIPSSAFYCCVWSHCQRSCQRFSLNPNFISLPDATWTAKYHEWRGSIAPPFCLRELRSGPWTLVSYCWRTQQWQSTASRFRMWMSMMRDLTSAPFWQTRSPKLQKFTSLFKVGHSQQCCSSKKSICFVCFWLDIVSVRSFAWTREGMATLLFSNGVISWNSPNLVLI